LEKAKETGVSAYDRLDALLETTQPDLLDIIVPPQAHTDAILTALNQGVRWIICQKPFCQSLSEASAISDRAKSLGATVIVHENFRFQPWYRRIKSAIDEGLVGQPLQMTFRLRPGDGQGDGAYLDRQPYFQKMERFLVHETAVHWIDTFRFLFGDPKAVYADLRRFNPVIAGEDAGMILFDFEGDIRAAFDGNRLLDHSSDNMRRTMGEALMEGTTGSIELRGDGSLKHRAFGTSDYQTLMAPDESDEFGGDCVHALQSHVIDGMRGLREIENLADQYLKVIEIEEAIYTSYATGRKIDLV
ncbi:MAG: Gfo/Idh/MocA family oxidoreductase, partial [Pseudomonadota bacterium]